MAANPHHLPHHSNSPPLSQMTSSAHFSFLILLLLVLPPPSSSSDATALLTLKLAVDPQSAALPLWQPGAALFYCRWPGVKACLRNRVSRLVLENLNLTGQLDGKSLNRLDQLRVLSFKHNRITGEIPDLSGAASLKSIYLSGNAFTGQFPAWVSALHHLKTIVLSDNLLAGEIPPAIVALPRLHTLYVDSNGFTGAIPPLNQTTLKFLNFSGNRFFGRIPETVALAQFSSSAFSGNPGLCGEVIHTPCLPPATTINLPPNTTTGGKNNRHYKATTMIVVSSVLLIILVAVLLTAGVAHQRGKAVAGEGGRDKKAEATGAASKRYATTEGAQSSMELSREGAEELVFVGPAAEEDEQYTVEELLKATAETLGRGAVGTTYKAVMESGCTMTVKRMRDGGYPPASEFQGRAEALGRMRHPNLVPMRAYFQTNEERLLVYDYFSNGNLFSLLHVSRVSGCKKPLHWTSCLKIAEDVANGLLYIHQTSKMAHGNLKSTNILLGREFESCLTDYCLQSFQNPNIFNEPTTPSYFYKAPELRCSIQKLAQASPSLFPWSDVYSFGVILLELLTGKSPSQDVVAEYKNDILKLVRSTEDSSLETTTSKEKSMDLMNIAMDCVAMKPEERPSMNEVLRMLQGVRGEVVMSSSFNGNNHSLGGWGNASNM